jgi:hypothetical protein
MNAKLSGLEVEALFIMWDYYATMGRLLLIPFTYYDYADFVSKFRTVTYE